MEISQNIQQDEAKSDIWTLGSEMRSMRISRGLSLEDVAERLKIKASVLSALEEGQEDNLPGRIYTLGFIRAYAEFLGLDGAEAVARYKREHDISIQPVELNFPVPPPSSGLPKKWIMLVAVGAAVAIFAGWQTYDRSRQIDVETVAAPPGTESMTQQQAQVSPPAGPETAPAGGTGLAADGKGQPGDERPSADAMAAGGVTVAPLSAEGAEGGDAVSSARAGSDAALTTEAEARPPSASPSAAAEKTADRTATQDSATAQGTVAAQTDAAATAQTAEDSAAGVVSSAMAAPSAAAGENDASASEAAPAASSSSARPGEAVVPPPALPEREPVNLATADSRAGGQVLGDKGGRIVIRARQESWVQVTSPDRTLLTRVLRPGDEFRVPDMKGLRLDTGNAGGLEIWVDGQRIPPLAAVGNAISGVELSPAKLLARR